MSYKDRHPVLSQSKNFEVIMPATCPFDQLEAHVLEFFAPDYSTRFLSLTGWEGTSEHTLTQYLVEAPLTCKNRIAYEIGDLTWSKFWKDRPWMIRLRWYFGSDFFNADYITPVQMDTSALKTIDKFDLVSPMDEKLRALSNIVSRRKDSSDRLYDYHKIYRDFLPVYQRRMGKRVA